MCMNLHTAVCTCIYTCIHTSVPTECIQEYARCVHTYFSGWHLHIRIVYIYIMQLSARVPHRYRCKRQIWAAGFNAHCSHCALCLVHFGHLRLFHDHESAGEMGREIKTLDKEGGWRERIRDRTTEGMCERQNVRTREGERANGYIWRGYLWRSVLRQNHSEILDQIQTPRLRYNSWSTLLFNRDSLISHHHKTDNSTSYKLCKQSTPPEGCRRGNKKPGALRDKPRRLFVINIHFYHHVRKVYVHKCWLSTQIEKSADTITKTRAHTLIDTPIRAILRAQHQQQLSRQRAHQLVSILHAFKSRSVYLWISSCTFALKTV